MSGLIPRPFDPERFAERRQSRAGSYGRTLTYSPETGSTNDDALAAARTGAPNGSVFITEYQREGRGRRGKTWVAAPGHNLLFSIVLRAAVDAPLVSALTLAVGLGVRHALAPYGDAPLAVKWPNDVLAGSRKLAGILCEGQFDGQRLVAVVIGIGINVLRAELPPELAEHATSLAALAPRGTAIEREAVLLDVLDAVEARVATCVEAGFGALASEFSEHDALAGAWVEVTGSSPVTGTARGVDPTGRLLVESDGLLVPVVSGTVRVVGEQS